jgi:LacI family transcriptional regulator
MSIKAKDLAKMLDVSPATVSLVLNNKPGISDATRERVRATLQELGHEDLIKDEEAEKKSILFIVYRKHAVTAEGTPYFSQLFSEIIELVESQIKLKGYNLMVAYLDETCIKTQLQELIHRQVEGILVLATEMQDDQLRSFFSVKVPVVLLDNYLEEEDADCVTINNEQGVYKAVKHLTDMGHTRIGYLHVCENARNFRERHFGFFRAMELCGHHIDPEHLINIATEGGGEEVYLDLKRQFQEKTAFPTAFFADNDIVAICAIRALRELGHRIPDDISIVGFDNMALSEMLDPPLTTIQIQKKSMGATAVNTLIEYMNNNKMHGVKIEVATKLIVRESVKNIAGQS